MKKKLFSCTLLFLIAGIQIYAQIGINTHSPSALFEVESNTSGGSNKVLRITNSTNVETLQVNNDGYIGLGVSNPLVNLDLRGTDGAIGIGYTNMDAANAAAGAIRYNSSFETLEYSDGTQWIRLQANPQRAFVVANNSSGQTIAQYSSTPPVYAETLHHWTVLSDLTGSFNPTTGTFIAPRTGLYSVSVTAVFNPINVPVNGHFELTIYAGPGNSLKTVTPYPSPAVSVPLTSISRSIFYVSQGQTIYTSVYIANFVTAPQLSTDGSFNLLTIAEM